MLAAQRQHRQRQRRLAQRPVLLGRLVRRAVIAQHAAQAAQRLVDALVLIQVGAAEHARLVGGLAAEEPLDQHPLASLQQRFGQVGHGVEEEMPALPVVRSQLEAGGQRHAGDVRVQQHQALDLVGVARRVGIGDPGADVVPGQRVARQAQRVEQRPQALAGAAGVIAIERLVRIALARQVDRVQAEMRRQQRHHPAPGVPALRKAGQQDQRRPGAALHHVIAQAVHAHLAVAKRHVVQREGVGVLEGIHRPSPFNAARRRLP